MSCVRHTSDHSPLHLVDTTQQKLPESARLLDLAKHRFHYRLAGRVHRFARLGFQLASHAINPRSSLRQRTARAGFLVLAMLLPLRGDVSIDAVFRVLL